MAIETDFPWNLTVSIKDKETLRSWLRGWALFKGEGNTVLNFSINLAKENYFFNSNLSCLAEHLHWSYFLSVGNHFHHTHCPKMIEVKESYSVDEDPLEMTGTCPDDFQSHNFLGNPPKWSPVFQWVVEEWGNWIGSFVMMMKLKDVFELLVFQMSRQFQSLHEQAVGYASHSCDLACSSV